MSAMPGPGRYRVPVLGCALAILLASGCARQSETPPSLPGDLVPAGTALGAGAIVGRVLYRGPVIASESISMQSDAFCHQSHAEPSRPEDLIVEPDGALRNAFVRVASGMDRKFAPPAAPVTLDQRGCLYQPRVAGMQVGQPLHILNSDATLHNVHTTSQANPSFNFGMTLQGQGATRYFHAEEVMIQVRCNVHSWMTAFIGVLWHPFFDVTADGGRFAMRSLPAGEYVVEAWHERLGAIRRAVTLGPDETAEIILEFSE